MQKNILSDYNRIWAISALGGDFVRTRQLHRKIADKFQIGDKVIYLGNVFGKGSDNLKTVNEVLFFRRALLALPSVKAGDILFLKGSCEDLLLKTMQLAFCPSPKPVLKWMFDQGLEELLQTYNIKKMNLEIAASKGAVALSYFVPELKKKIKAHDGHFDYLMALQKEIHTKDETLLFVHRGLFKQKSLLRQEEAFCWGGTLPFETEEPYKGFSKVIRTLPYQENASLCETEFYLTLLSGGGHDGSVGAALLDKKGKVLDFLKA